MSDEREAPAGRPDEWLEHAKAAHAALLGDVAGLDDDQARGASLLPHWSRGHVLTHLARNADSNTGIFRAAAAGDVVAQYPGGVEQRTNDIEAGCNRPAAELVADLVEAIGRLEAAWDTTPDEVWATGQGGSMARGPVSLQEWVFSRWRETEVHHSDLGIGFSWVNWSAPYVAEELRRATVTYAAQQPAGQGELPAGALALVPSERLAWLMGRHWPDGLPEAPRWI
jgi:maleylpyruvate isomerase